MTLHVAPAFATGRLRQEAIGSPPSKNSTVPVGCSVPRRPGGESTVAVYVVLAPTPTVFDTSSEVDVVSRPTGRLTIRLVDPVMVAPGPGEKVARSCGVEAANHVWQVTTTLWAIGLTGTFAHPEMTTELEGDERYCGATFLVTRSITNLPFFSRPVGT